MPLDDLDTRFIGLIRLYLSKYDGDAHPSIETLARELGVDRTTVLRHRHRLEKDGYLRVVVSTGRGRSNRYHLTEKALRETVAKTSQKPSHGTVAKAPRDSSSTLVSSTLVSEVHKSTSETDGVLESTSRPEATALASPPPPAEDNVTDPWVADPWGAVTGDAGGLPLGVQTCWHCGEVVLTRRGEVLAGVEDAPGRWRHLNCPEPTKVRRCFWCGQPVDPVTSAKTLSSGEPHRNTTAIAGYELRLADGRTIVTHDVEECGAEAWAEYDKGVKADSPALA